ncbi:3'-5' exonuclease family protein [Halomonas sp. YLGW01]|uniref:3'-5' exonuclease family protein n=1 Tax=Halomonas sp. YLGW01 TaxID=2773308 RepID=UPI0017871DE2|nr:3'-5' exonuclease family protein [Halomonas sp. YLGW01]
MIKVFLDLETTGTRTTRDRITEIAALKVFDGEVVERFVQLVNPGQPIPAQIQRLTGITEAMVEDAPRFADLADAFYAFLGDAELVAHNMRFDYGFLRNEFARADIQFRARTLCTLKLSRRLAPEHPHHNLDALIERYDLPRQARHRAEGDAEALLALWQHWQTQVDEDHFATLLAEQRRMPSLPSQLDPGLMQEIPERPGVYLFYGHNRLPLYIGKSINLRARVLTHFHDDLSQDRKMRLTQQIQDLEWHETAGDLGAQLLEARLIKSRLPIMNRRLRRQGGLMGWQWPAGETAPRLVRAEEIAGRKDEPLYGLFHAGKEARQALKQIAEHHGLCPRLLGLEKGRGRCFSSQLGRCRGACHGQESRDAHDARAREALARLRVQQWPWPGRVAIGEGMEGDSVLAWHVVDQWCYLGSIERLDQASLATLDGQPVSFDIDTYKILRRALDRDQAHDQGTATRTIQLLDTDETPQPRED